MARLHFSRLLLLGIIYYLDIYLGFYLTNLVYQNIHFSQLSKWHSLISWLGWIFEYNIVGLNFNHMIGMHSFCCHYADIIHRQLAMIVLNESSSLVPCGNVTPTTECWSNSLGLTTCIWSN